MKITLIGDAHGKIERLNAIQALHSEGTVQLGDMGFGFHDIPSFSGPQHLCIRGNHDDPMKARQHTGYLGDFGQSPRLPEGTFFLSGAFSIDYFWRTAGVSWWPDEELPIQSLYAAYDRYMKVKPAVMLTHECPTEAMGVMLQHLLLDSYHGAKMGCATSRTAQALQSMFEEHKPKFWVFGHHHLTKGFDWKGTRFQCLNELETAELELASDNRFELKVKGYEA